MTFNNIQVAEQPGGQIYASGTDEVGPFTFQGHFSQNDTSVAITKQYTGKHTIFYQGALDRQTGEINGYWGFNVGGQDGKFRMKKF